MKSSKVAVPRTTAAVLAWAKDIAVDLARWPRGRTTGANTYLTARYLHVYLTDVDEDSAPMKYMRKSHRPGTLKSKSLRNADRGVIDDEVWTRFSPADAMTVTGPAGTTFMSNSNGLHRGTPARTRDRLFLVVPIQATSFAGYQLKPRKVTPKDPEFAALLAQNSSAVRWFRPSNS